MKTLLSIVASLVIAGYAAACPVAVQSFGSCGVAAQAVVPSCGIVQQSFVAPQAIALQQFAVVPQAVHVQAVAVQSVPVVAVGCGHGCGIVRGAAAAPFRVLGRGGGRSVIRQRQVIRTR